jgi:hypothetical protein
MNPVYWIPGAGLVAIIAITAFYFIQRKREKSSVAASLSHPLRGKAAEEFAAKAKAFIGLYEPLYMLKEGTLKLGEGVFADFGARVENMEEYPALVSFWGDTFADTGGWDQTAYAKKAGELLAFIREAGVFRGTDTQVTAGREIYRYYFPKDGKRIEYDVVARVELPYWALGDHVLEKGIISLEEEGN